MAISIDLLPGYVGLRRVFKRLVAGCLLLIGLVAGILFLLYTKSSGQLEIAQQNADAWDKLAKKTEDVQTETKGIQTASAPLQSLIQFLQDTGRTGAERAQLIDVVRRYIYSSSQPGLGALVSSIDLSDGKTVKINATVNSPDEYATFLDGLRRGSKLYIPPGPAFEDFAVASGVPGYPPPKAVPFEFVPGAPVATPAPGNPGTPGTSPVMAVSAAQPMIVPVYPLKITATTTLKSGAPNAGGLQVVLPVEPGGAGAAPTPGP